MLPEAFISKNQRTSERIPSNGYSMRHPSNNYVSPNLPRPSQRYNINRLTKNQDEKFHSVPYSHRTRNHAIPRKFHGIQPMSYGNHNYPSLSAKDIRLPHRSRTDFPQPDRQACNASSLAVLPYSPQSTNNEYGCLNDPNNGSSFHQETDVSKKSTSDASDKRPKSTRVLTWTFILGFVPLTILGWIIGTIYGFFVKKDSKGFILHNLNGVMGFFGVLVLLAVLAITGYQAENFKLLPPARTLSCIPGLTLHFTYWSQPNRDHVGTIVFLGRLSAHTWRETGILQIGHSLGFQIFALSPPGIGLTTNDSSSSKIGDSGFLYYSLRNCLDIQMKDLIIVTQDNYITRVFTFPFIMYQNITALVLLDTNFGDNWLTYIDPIVNDHLYYPILVNKKMILQVDVEESAKYDANVKNQSTSPRPVKTEHLRKDNPEQKTISEEVRIYCGPKAAEIKMTENNKAEIAAWGGFDSRYMQKNWVELEQEIRESLRDESLQYATASTDKEKDETTNNKLIYLLSKSYFSKLHDGLQKFLPKVKVFMKSNETTASPDVPFSNIRQAKFFENRVDFLKVPETAIYCI